MNCAELEVVLEGVPLPAGRAELVRYALAQGAPAEAVEALGSLPDREFGSLDEVGEELEPVQPRRERPPEAGATRGERRPAGRRAVRRQLSPPRSLHFRHRCAAHS
jgi:uncharacterized protein DUF2795